jgi:hypothetical protein
MSPILSPRLYSVFDSATWPGSLEVLEGGGQKALFYRSDDTLTADANYGVEVGEDVYRFSDRRRGRHQPAHGRRADQAHGRTTTRARARPAPSSAYSPR